MMTNSENYYSLLKQYTPGGSQTLSKMPCRYIEGVYPKVLERGKGSHVWDVDGNEYIDLISGLGAISVGYANDDINDAIYMQMIKGAVFSLPTTLEYFVSRKLTELVPWSEMWKFGKNGTDGTVMAVRAARAYTGRTKIMTVGYNGCADQFEIRGVRTAGIPKELDCTIDKAIYNDLNTFKALETERYACLLLEPMVVEHPKPGFLESLRELCTKTGTVLIFDEVVTGGRFEGFTAHSYFKVQPDLCVLSKGIANGLPLSSVGGRRSVMATYERDDFFASGTFGGECLALAAFLATQKILTENSCRMIVNGQRIKDAFNELDWEAKAVGYPTRLDFQFVHKEQRHLYWQEMCKQGILVGYNNFIMASHSSEDVNRIIQAIYTSYKNIKSGVKLEGPAPSEALRKS